MAVIKVDLEDKYNTKTENEIVSTEITIGDAQPNYSVTIFLDQKFIGNKPEQDIGKASEVRGKLLTVVVVVQDKKGETNWTSFSLNMVEGTHAKPYGPYSKKAENDQDTIIYTLKIDME